MMMDRYTHEPEGSMWINEPTYTAGTAPEDWESAAKTLNALGQFVQDAGTVAGGEAASMALVDAEERARIQARRAREEGWTEPENGEPAPGQAERLRRLIHRFDHIAMAAELIREAAKTEPDRRYAEGYMLGELVPALEAMRDEAGAEIRRYRREIGMLAD
jgi:hypothetical protein